MPRFGVPVGRRFTYLIRLLIRSIHWFCYIANHSLYIAQSYTYNDANRYNLPNIHVYSDALKHCYLLCAICSVCQRVLFFAPVRLVFTFATLRARMVANVLRISRGFRMVAKRV